MKSTDDYLKEYQKTAMERLEYFNHRLHQRRNLDAEIDSLCDRVQWDFQYILSLLEGKEIPPVPVSEAPNPPDVKNVMPPKPEISKRKFPPRKSSPRRSGNTRPVIQMDANGTVIQRFKSGKEASCATGIASPYISVAANTASYTRDGSHWRFEDSYDSLEHQWPVVVVSADGNHKKRYDTALEAAKALGIPLREFQIILHTKSHKDVSKNLYYWYADEYNFCGDL